MRLVVTHRTVYRHCGKASAASHLLSRLLASSSSVKLTSFQKPPDDWHWPIPPTKGCQKLSVAMLSSKRSQGCLEHRTGASTARLEVRGGSTSCAWTLIWGWSLGTPAPHSLSLRDWVKRLSHFMWAGFRHWVLQPRCPRELLLCCSMQLRRCARSRLILGIGWNYIV